MLNEQLRNDIERFVAENESALFADIAKLVAVNSVNGPAKEGMPFGEGPAKALDLALEMARGMGLQAENCEGMIGYAQLGEGGRDCKDYLATITHLDVVPVGEGWTSDPFTMREKDGYIIGRGVMDDKGPSVLCLYALKYLKERNVPLRYPVRALLGVNEEIAMKDVEYYLESYPAPLFCFSPDADFPLCNGEKGIFHARMNATVPMQNIVDIHGGFAANAVCDKAEATVKGTGLVSTESVTAEDLGNGCTRLTAVGIGGHASMPQGTVNAIGVLMHYILDNGLAGEDEGKFLTLCNRIHDNHDGSLIGLAASDGPFGPLTVVSGVIGIENGHMFTTIDSRYPTTTSGEKIEQTLREAAGELASFEVDRDTPPFYMPLEKPEVQVCIKAYNAITGETAEPYTIGGGTYARDFPNAVSFGPEHPERPAPDFAGPIHGVDEAACKDFFTEALKVYILALLELEKLDY